MNMTMYPRPHSFQAVSTNLKSLVCAIKLQANAQLGADPYHSIFDVDVYR